MASNLIAVFVLPVRLYSFVLCSGASRMEELMKTLHPERGWDDTLAANR